ncbi:oxidoreductase [Pseudomonas aeruginosa]|nr:oxidoreductase [Pseudomonas aeruginosa]
MTAGQTARFPSTAPIGQPDAWRFSRLTLLARRRKAPHSADSTTRPVVWSSRTRRAAAAGDDNEEASHEQDPPLPCVPSLRGHLRARHRDRERRGRRAADPLDQGRPAGQLQPRPCLSQGGGPAGHPGRPDRLRQPLRRVGSEWQPIGWDEAFALVASRLGEIRERHGNDAVAVYQGNPSVHNYGLMTHSNYFLGLLKTRNRFSATSVDQLPHHLVSQQMYGHGLLIPIPDIDHTDFMLVLGGNPLASNGSIMTVPDVEKRLKALKARGGRLVVVDPRRSETAAIADRHLFHSSRPGCGAVARDTQHPVRGEPRSPHAAAGRRAGAGARGGRGLRRRVHERALWRAGRKHSPTGAGFRRRRTGGLLWPDGRFHPGFRHALPVAGATDQPGHRQPRPGRWRAVHLAGPGPGGEYLGWPLRPLAQPRLGAAGIWRRTAGGGIGGRNPRRRRGAGARAGHGSR